MDTPEPKKLVDYSRFASNGEDVEVGPDIERPLSPTERLLAWSEQYAKLDAD